jgi:hypothetical protein
MKKDVFIVVFLSVLLCLSSASADVILPGEHAVKYSFEITNINSYPDYVFFYFIMGPGDDSFFKVERISEVNEPSFYKFSTAKAYMIKSNLFNDNIIPNTAGIIDLNFSFNSQVSYVGDENPLIKVRDVFEIVQTIDSFKLEPKKVIYYYNDGTSEEKIIQNGKKSEPSRNLTLAYVMIYFLIPIIALLALVYLLIRRKNEK